MDKITFTNYLNKYTKLMALYLNNKEDPNFDIGNEELAFFIKLSKHHSLMAFLYKAISEVRVKVDEDKIHKIEEYYLANLRKSVLFDKERKDIYAFFNENEIEFLPLKGIILKDYYLDPYTREFADNDILFANKDKLIKNFFVKRGYEVESFRKSNHDVYLKKPFFNFEIHRDLFDETEDNKKNVKYFKDYLAKAPVKENHEHYLSNEDFYIYFLAHTYKHYHVSGCGLRTLIDIYLYLKKEQLDFNYINKELEKLDLVEFSKEIIDLSFALFDEKELNEEQNNMLLFIASSGTYGTLEHSVKKGVKEKGKFGYAMKRVFPPYSFYKNTYKWAYKIPILIPIAWLCRFFRILFKNPKKATKELKMISEVKEEETTK